MDVLGGTPLSGASSWSGAAVVETGSFRGLRPRRRTVAECRERPSVLGAVLRAASVLALTGVAPSRAAKEAAAAVFDPSGGILPESGPVRRGHADTYPRVSKPADARLGAAAPGARCGEWAGKVGMLDAVPAA